LRSINYVFLFVLKKKENLVEKKQPGKCRYDEMRGVMIASGSARVHTEAGSHHLLTDWLTTFVRSIIPLTNLCWDLLPFISTTLHFSLFQILTFILSNWYSSVWMIRRKTCVNLTGVYLLWNCGLEILLCDMRKCIPTINKFLHYLYSTLLTF
jgi:hypothetical protein